MSDASDDPGSPTYDHVSTRRLPSPETVQAIVEEAHSTYADDRGGRNSQVYPALAEVPGGLFGACIVDTAGRSYPVGDCDHEFAIMSVSKPFVFALVCQEFGPEVARDKLGANSTGLAFNSLAAIDQSRDGRTNPMVNPGAIMTTSLVPGADADARWQFILDGLSRFAGRPLAVNESVYESALETNLRNRGMASVLHSMGRMYSDAPEAVELYTRQCSLSVTARDLAVMGATLADGGRNPISGDDVVDPMVCHYTLAVMATAGMYETSGDWLYEVHLPGKSGIGGGIVTVSPGRGGLGTFAPPLDEAGNSVKGSSSRGTSRSASGWICSSRPAGAETTQEASREASRPTNTVPDVGPAESSE